MDWNLLIIAGVKFLACFVAFNAVLMIVAYIVLAERRLLGFIQGRIGPNRVGPQGVLQPFADLLKFIFKEDIIPDKSTRFVYFLAPLIAVTTALMPVLVYPFGPSFNVPYLDKVPYIGKYLIQYASTIPLTVSHFDVGLLYVLGITSIGVYGIALAGWSSNNKYSLMGALRSAAQLISYELAMGLALVSVVLVSGSLDLTTIVEGQNGRFGITGWNIWSGFQLVGFLVYLMAAIAETNRVPFDLPEAETELVAGFHTEYSALKFALFFMAEYINMFTVSMLATTLYLGGWHGPGINWLQGNGHEVIAGVLGLVYFFGKVFGFLFLYIWLRGTLPRFRFDQLMDFGWKFLLPVALANIVFTATLQYLPVLDWWGRIMKYPAKLGVGLMFGHF
jgi:NADH-quinone oxidoreductase subunit H